MLLSMLLKVWHSFLMRIIGFKNAFVNISESRESKHVQERFERWVILLGSHYLDGGCR